MINYDVGYRTGSGHELSLNVQGHFLGRNEVTVFEHQDMPQLCQQGSGCKGYGGGCPPHAPAYEKVKPSLPNLYAIFVVIDMAWACHYAAPRPSPIAANYFRLSWADRLTESYIRRLLYRVVQSSDGYGLGAGNCPGCSVAIGCSVARGDKCAAPHKREYSIEATGVECSALTEKCLGRRMSWWYKSEYLPAEMIRVVGVLTDDTEYEMDCWLKAAVEDDHSLCEVPVMMPGIKFVTNAPAGSYDEGMEYMVYYEGHLATQSSGQEAGLYGE